MFLKEFIPQRLLSNAISLKSIGLNELAWDKTSALEIIKCLDFVDIGILGGDLYRLEPGKIIPLSDNWYCDKKSNENNKEYSFRSKIKALNYIKSYPVDHDEKIIISLIFTDINSA